MSHFTDFTGYVLFIITSFLAGVESADQCLLNSKVLSCFSGVIMSIRSFFSIYNLIEKNPSHAGIIQYVYLSMSCASGIHLPIGFNKNTMISSSSKWICLTSLKSSSINCKLLLNRLQAINDQY